MYVRCIYKYSKTCVKGPLSKRLKVGFQDQLSLNAGQKYCRMLQGEHSAILSTFIKLPIVIKIFVLSIFEWLFYTGFTEILFSEKTDVSPPQRFKFGVFRSIVTMKIMARSPKPQHIFIMAQCYIHASLVPIHPVVQEIFCTQRSTMLPPTLMGPNPEAC